MLNLWNARALPIKMLRSPIIPLDIYFYELRLKLLLSPDAKIFLCHLHLATVFEFLFRSYGRECTCPPHFASNLSIIPAAFNASGENSTLVGLNPNIEGASMIKNVKVELCNLVKLDIIYSEFIKSKQKRNR